MAIANIGKKDFFWTLTSMIVKVGAGVLLYPFVLRYLPAQEVGIWTIFGVIGTLTVIFDFGFNPSFTRNISYIYSGVSNLHKKGFETVSPIHSHNIDYVLLNSTIKAMKLFYSRIAVALFVVLITLGTLYINTLITDYIGDKAEIYVSWVLVCSINCYLLYTKYYESLLIGKGLVKRSSQITLLGYIVYVGAAIIFLLLGYGIVAVVASQGFSTVIIRVLSRKTFYTKQVKSVLANADNSRYKEVLNAIYPNAVKLGLTSLGGFVINKSSTFIGSLFVPLETMASYGISMQIVVLISQVACVLIRVNLPKIYKWRVENNISSLRRMFWLTSSFIFVVFLMGGTLLVLFGDSILVLIKSNTMLLPNVLLIVLLIQNYLETNHSNAAEFLSSKNEVPFFTASLISAVGVIVLLYLFEAYLNMGILGMILAPTIVQALYQNWRWPAMVISDLYRKS